MTAMKSANSTVFQTLEKYCPTALIWIESLQQHDGKCGQRRWMGEGGSVEDRVLVCNTAVHHSCSDDDHNPHRWKTLCMHG